MHLIDTIISKQTCAKLLNINSEETIPVRLIGLGNLNIGISIC